MQEVLKKLLESLGRDATETDEEQKMGIRIMKSLIKRLHQDSIPDWLFCEEWEDALIPVRIPKGMSDQLKQMDEARTEITDNEDCRECVAKVTCPLLQRNPSEVLLTFLLKLSFAKVVAEIKMKEVISNAGQDGSNIRPEV